MHWHLLEAMSKEAEQLLEGLCEIINQQQVLQAFSNKNGNQVANEIFLGGKQQKSSKLFVRRREETVLFVFGSYETEVGKEKKVNTASE